MRNGVSIIIPNYNKGSFVKQTINSVISQDFGDWELIVVDDASIDNSLEVIRSICSNNLKCQVVTLEKSHGGSYCRNVGLAKARGEFVIFLDSDDVLHPSC